ncbi:MAG TPA: hypothetical protein VJ982_10730 [Gemmatimonadota bacterium]|nr:hypothetical protein [Gemmatimonadota bacterium]
MRRIGDDMQGPVRECPREREALAAVVTGALEPPLERHVAQCAECREVIAVSTWLQGIARADAEALLPRAERVWWRAQVDRRLAARHAMAERAARPIRWFERGAAAAIAIALGGIVWSHVIPTADAAVQRLSDPATFGALAAGLLAVAALAARGAVRNS